MPFFSIIIPSLNSANTLSITLESILKQSFTDFEILIMEGLSTDNTLEIVKSYNDKRIKIFSEKDNGIYDAMNKGIKLAQGEWLYFLGSDDSLIGSNVLTNIFTNSNSTNLHVLYGNVISPRFNGRYDGEFSFNKLNVQNICHQAIFFNKKIFTKIGLFNLKYISHADWDHNLRWFLNDRIKSQYIDIDIANYADGGYSSLHGDIQFAYEKNYNIIKYGFNSLPKSYLYKLCKGEYLQSKQKWNYNKLFTLLVYILYLKVCLKFRL